MTVVLLSGDITRPGGTERMALSLAGMFYQELGYHTAVLSLSGAGKEPFYPIEKGISLFFAPVGGVAKKILWLRRMLSRLDADVLIGVDIGTALYTLPGAFLKKTRVISWEHGNFYNDWGSKWIPFFRRAARYFGDALVVLTKQDEKTYIQNIPHGCPIRCIYNPAPEVPDHLYDIGSRTILSVGNLIPVKGFDKAVEAAKMVLESRPGWRWEIWGEGPLLPELQRNVREKGLEGRVVFRGLAREIHMVYDKSAIMVMTSQMEGLPLTLLEAKAHKLPIVSFDIMTGPADILTNGVNGFLVPAGDTAALAEKIGLLMDNSALRQRFSDSARQDIGRFDKKEILSQWEALIWEVSGR